jgi:hypothetical protein
MTPQHASLEREQRRRAGVRRTAWIVAAIALAVYVLFFVQQLVWR